MFKKRSGNFLSELNRWGWCMLIGASAVISSLFFNFTGNNDNILTTAGGFAIGIILIILGVVKGFLT